MLRYGKNTITTGYCTFGNGTSLKTEANICYLEYGAEKNLGEGTVFADLIEISSKTQDGFITIKAGNNAHRSPWLILKPLLRSSRTYSNLPLLFRRNISKIWTVLGLRCLPPGYYYKDQEITPMKTLYEHGEIVTYHCKDKATMMEKDNTRVCGNDNLWTGNTPKCLIGETFL